MRSKQATPSVLVPRFIGRSEGDMTAKGKTEQLELFRETLTRPAKVQVLAMMGLSDPKNLDKSQAARVADIAEAMGYERVSKGDRHVFDSQIYRQIEDTGLKLRRKSFEVFVREPAGFTKDGRRKWKTGLVDLSILQEFGFYYEDEEGQPINLRDIPEDKLIKYDSASGPPLFAIPVTDAKGRFVKNEDGSTRRHPANGVSWRFSSRFAELSQDRETAWVFYREAVAILRRYLPKPASFDLMFKTLFWTGTGLIEMSHDKLIQHLNVRSKDTKRVQVAIDAAFADALKEGIIDKPVTVREAGYYQPTKKTGRSRRKDKVYQWQRASKWQPGRNLIAVAGDRLEPYNEVKTERVKS